MNIRRLAVLTRPRVFIPVLIVALAVIVTISMAAANKVNRAEKQDQATITESKILDKQKISGMYDMINLITATYTNNRANYPLGTIDGWKNITETVPITESFTDPYTKTLYTFANTTPDYGEVTYSPGSDCNSKDQTFKKGTFRTIALRTKLYSGYRCVSSVEVQTEQSKNF